MADKIGVVGLGRMGKAIAQRVQAQGFETLGWNRSGTVQENRDRTGIECVADLPELVAHVDLIITSLFDDAAVCEVLDQLCACDLTGKLVVETSTVSPETLRGYVPAIHRAGATTIDAPISGGPETLLAGTAGIYIGGDKKDVTRFMPVGEALSNRIVHVGELGAGATAKIVNNMMIGIYWQGLKEAMSLGQKAGLDMDVMLPLLAGSPTANGILASRMGHLSGETDAVGFSIDGVVKDLGVFQKVAQGYGLDVPALSAVENSMRNAQDQGYGAFDFTKMLLNAIAPDAETVSPAKTETHT